MLITCEPHNLFMASQISAFNADTFLKLLANNFVYHSVRFGLTHWGQDKMAAILQMTFSDALSQSVIQEELSKQILSLKTGSIIENLIVHSFNLAYHILP